MESQENSNSVEIAVDSPEPDFACRICRLPDPPLFALCQCRGSLQYLHIDCLNNWTSHSGKNACELCLSDFRVTPRALPFCSWKKLKLQHGEGTKIVGVTISTLISLFFLVYTLLIITNVLETPFDLRTTPWTAILLILFELSIFLGISVYGICYYTSLFIRWKNQNVYLSVIPDTERDIQINST
ncbi:hypothetical protein RCL1_002022 [Eukaryota sp. TZLM3-RCL]